MITGTTERLTLRFGANQYILPGQKAAWGARLIVNQQGGVDMVPDRQDLVTAPGHEALGAKLQEWVRSAYGPAARNIAEGLRRHWIKTREASPQWVYEDGEGIMLGNTNASAGYFYLVGWTFTALPDGCRTKGADILVEEIKAATS